MGEEIRTARLDSHLQIEAYRFQGMMQRFPNHFHDYYVLGFVESGHRFMTCKNREYTIAAGDLVLFNPLDNHACEQVDGRALDWRCLNVSQEVMGRVAGEIIGANRLPVMAGPVVEQSPLVAPLRELHELILAEGPALAREEAFYLFMEQLLTGHTLPAASPPQQPLDGVGQVCGYLDAHYAEGVSLGELSRLTGQNKFTLLRAFTRARGITPYQYLETVRVNAAKKLLEQGMPPVEAALQAGFADQSHFTRHFKAMTGLTPRQYQRMLCP